VSIVQSRDDGMSTRALSVYLAWLFATKPFCCCYLSVRISIMSAMQDQQCAVRDACIGLLNADVVHIASHGEGAVPSSDSIPASPCPPAFLPIGTRVPPCAVALGNRGCALADGWGALVLSIGMARFIGMTRFK
jgi:hypothetical protein